jgi:hypothetical protein
VRTARFVWLEIAIRCSAPDIRNEAIRTGTAIVR